MRGKPRILVVDDSQSMRGLLRETLQDYDICETADGRAALREISQHLPDLILLDVQMPGVDGKSVLSILRNNPQTTHIPIIYITDVKDSHYSLELLARGADDIITKPCSTDLLKARVAYLLKVKYAYDELANVPHILSILAKQVESRVPFLQGHSAKVTKYAELMGHQLLFTSYDIHNLRIAASLILLGYVSVSDDCLKKPGIFTFPDWLAVERHPTLAQEICSPFSQLEHIGTWLAQHHEHFDGSGYPAGLAGTTISLGGRCLAIAEAYAALTSDRPHRKAYSLDEALILLKDGAGTQWDPYLVASFFSALVKSGYA